MARGGAREGSGRKSTGRKTAVFYVTDEEKQQLRAYLEKLRKKETGGDTPSYETVLESIGQTTMLTKPIKPKSNEKHRVKSKKSEKQVNFLMKEYVNEAFVDWKVDLSSNIRKLSKTSKRKAAQFLAEKLCKALNDYYLDNDNEIAKKKIDYAEDFIIKVVDSRVNTDYWINMTTSFMKYAGYHLDINYNENNEITKTWRKPLK